LEWQIPEKVFSWPRLSSAYASTHLWQKRESISLGVKLFTETPYLGLS
jgi:hypothetical protein